MDNRKLNASEKKSSKISSSTASAFQSFKSALKPRVHSDGIGIGPLDFRLRHIPANIAYLSEYSKETIAAIMFLLHLAEVDARGPKPQPPSPEFIEFSDRNHTTDYTLSATLRLISVIEKIKAGACNVTLNLDKSPTKYVLIKDWIPDIRFWRERNGTVLEEVETCLKNMIQGEVDALFTKQSDHKNLSIAISCGIAGGVLFLCLLITLICVVPRRSLLDTSRSISPSQPEGQELNNNEIEETRHTLPAVTISPTLAAKLKEIEESGPKRHFEERLKKIGYDLEKVPKDFLDPVFYFIMDDPVVVRDGFSADLSTVQAAIDGNPKAKCIFDRKYQLNEVMIPNYTLKNVIEAFVTKKEGKKVSKQDAQEENNVIIDIEKGILSRSQAILFANDEKNEFFESEEELPILPTRYTFELS